MTAIRDIETAVDQAQTIVEHLIAFRTRLNGIGCSLGQLEDVDNLIERMEEHRNRISVRLREQRERRGINLDGKGRSDGSPF